MVQQRERPGGEQHTSEPSKLWGNVHCTRQSEWEAVRCGGGAVLMPSNETGLVGSRGPSDPEVTWGRYLRVRELSPSAFGSGLPVQQGMFIHLLSCLFVLFFHASGRPFPAWAQVVNTLPCPGTEAGKRVQRLKQNLVVRGAVCCTEDRSVSHCVPRWLLTFWVLGVMPRDFTLEEGYIRSRRLWQRALMLQGGSL